MNANRRELHISSEARNLSDVRQTLGDLLAGTPFEGQLQNKLILAVDEALANVVEHAYSGDPGDIQIVFEIEPGNFRVTIRDNGHQFNPMDRINRPLDIQQAIQLGQKGGFGMFLMRQIMDEVHYTSGATDATNELVMIKRAPAASESP